MNRYLLLVVVTLIGCGKKAEDPSAQQQPPQEVSQHPQQQQSGDDTLRGTLGINSFAVSPSGVVAGAVNANPREANSWSVAVWDYSTGKRVQTIKVAENILRLAVSADGSMVAGICGPEASRTLRVWKIKTGEPLGQPRDLRTMWANELISTESFIAFSADGKAVVFGHGNRLSRNNLEGGKATEEVVTIGEKPREVRQARYVPASDQVALTTAAGVLRVFQADGEGVYGSRYGQAGIGRQALGTTYDGKRLAWGYCSRGIEDWVVDVFDTAKWEPIGKPITFPLNGREVTGEIAISGSGDRFAILFVDMVKSQIQIELWNAEGTRVALLTSALGTPSGGSFGRMAFAPDGKTLLVPCGNRSVRVYDAATGAEK